jgi:general secretion pathway protein A
MYKDFYQFKELPFNITADPDFFFSSARHLDAFANINFGVMQRKGIIVVTGEIGTGKTTLIRTFLSKQERNIKTALILNPNFSDTQLLQYIVRDLGIPGKFSNKFALINALNDFLLRETELGNNVVIIIDEAQNLSIRQLESIRLLSNLETTKEKLLQIVLVGQPELYEKLKLPALRQLNQRITVRFHMQPLEREEVARYIEHRLNVASIDGKSTVRLTDEAMAAIFHHSTGSPRMINILCDRVLLAGFLKEAHVLDKELVNCCAEEVFAYEYYS